METVKALKALDYQALSDCAHPEKGITFVPFLSIDLGENLTFTPAQITEFGADADQHVWGCYDQSPELIKLTINEYFEHFVNDKDYLNVNQIGIRLWTSAILNLTDSHLPKDSV